MSTVPTKEQLQAYADKLTKLIQTKADELDALNETIRSEALAVHQEFCVNENSAECGDAFLMSFLQRFSDELYNRGRSRTGERIVLLEAPEEEENDAYPGFYL